MLKKILTVAIILAVIYAGYSQKDTLLEIIRAGGYLSVGISMLLVAICVYFPVVPFIFLVGVIGAVFGTWMGAFITLAGALLGASSLFLISRFGFREWAQNQLAKYPKAKEYEDYFEQNAFLSIVAVRAVPVLPGQAVNILCGVSKVPFWVFFVATAIGAFPRTFIFSFVGNSFEDDKFTSLMTYGVYTAIIMVLVYVFMRKRMNSQPQDPQ